MAQYGPSSAFLLVGGRNISGDTFNLDETVESILEETHGLGESWEESVPVGIGRVLLEATGGVYDDRVGGIVEALQAKGSTLQLVSYGMSGVTAGAEVVQLNGSYAVTWKRISARDGLLHANAVHKITGDYKRGRILHPPTAETSASGTTAALDQLSTLRVPTGVITSSSIANPTVITCPADHGLVAGEIIVITGHSGSTPSLNAGNGYAISSPAAKTFTIPVNVSAGGTGGRWDKVSSLATYGDLHVLALTLGGYTSVTIKVRHSIDNSTYVDLLTFTNVTTVAFAERQQILTQANRWLQMTWLFNGGGSGMSITPYVAVSR